MTPHGDRAFHPRVDNLTVADFRLALDNLFTDPARLALFKQTAAYIIYGAELNTVRSQLPLILAGNRPLAEHLAFADGDHDGIGSALYTFADAILMHPFLSPELKDTARNIQAQFVPARSVLQATYKKEAATAQANRPKLNAMEASLKDVPTPDKQTAYQWVETFLDAGDKIGQLLVERSKQEAEETHPELTRIRVNVWSLVSKARRTVAEEVKRNPSLPRNTDAILFGFFDTLSDFRKAGKKDEEPPAAPEAPAAEGG